MNFFRKMDSRSREAHEAYNQLLLKSVSSLYNACFLALLSLPASFFIKNYFSNDPTKELTWESAIGNIHYVFIALGIIVIMAVVALIMETKALNIIDKYSEKDNKENSKLKNKVAKN